VTVHVAGRVGLRLDGFKFAQALADQYQGDVIERVGFLGTDEIYWGIRIRGHVLTLHSQHFIGVFLCASDEASEQCLRGDGAPQASGEERGGGPRDQAMIKKLASGKYRLYSRKKNPKTGKRRNLGTFSSLAAAKRHERAVQYFKRGG
jgi:hypothetical protein